MRQPTQAVPGALYVVGTPLGNLGDISARAAEILGSVDIIACEDTRHSLPLLQHLGIRRPLVSLHEHNEAARTVQLVAEMRGGKSVACISDAGMPLVSDPGARLVRAARLAGLRVEVVPGPSAPITALAGSGFPADRFYFGGFLPVKQGQRRREVQAALEREVTSVFFESPHRLAATLQMVAEAEPERLLCVARELTKKFEEFRTGSAAELAGHYQRQPPRGEITLIFSGRELPRWFMREPEAPDS